MKQVFSNFSEEEFNELITSAVNNALKNQTQQKVQSSEDVLLSRQETASYLKISLVTLHEWTNQGILKSYKIGGRVYYKQDEIIGTARAVNSKS
jgi:excisionase family DNA binding protein